MIGIWTAGEYSDHYAGFVDLGDDPRKVAFFKRFAAHAQEAAIAERVEWIDTAPMTWGEFVDHYDTRSMHGDGCAFSDNGDGRAVDAAMGPWPSPPKSSSERDAWVARRKELVEAAAAECPCWKAESEEGQT